MKNWRKMPPRERRRALVNAAFEMTKAALSPALRIRRSRRRDNYRNRIRIEAINKDRRFFCGWPNEEVFFFGGNGLMSIFAFIEMYSNYAYDEIWSAACEKLAWFAALAEYRSIEELVLAMTISGEGRADE